MVKIQSQLLAKVKERVQSLAREWFNMNLRVMRPADGIMMKLVKYNPKESTETVGESTDSEIIHNHSLKKAAGG